MGVIDNSDWFNSVAQLCLTLFNPMNCAYQVPPSMGFPRQEYSSGLPFVPPGDLSNPGMKPCLLYWQMDSLPLSHLRVPK